MTQVRFQNDLNYLIDDKFDYNDLDQLFEDSDEETNYMGEVEVRDPSMDLEYLTTKLLEMMDIMGNSISKYKKLHSDIQEMKKLREQYCKLLE